MKLTLQALRRRYTRVVKIGQKWNTYLQIDHQGFCVVEQTTRRRAAWFATQLSRALERMLSSIVPPATPPRAMVQIFEPRLGSPPEALKWLIYDVEWLLEQQNKITVSRNREVIKRALAFLKHVEANNQTEATA